jgi:hypothetical protein
MAVDVIGGGLAGVTGKYFSKTQEARSNQEPYQSSANERLWQSSEAFTGFAKADLLAP